MKAHFVTFLSPGTFVHETTTQGIESWDVAAACKMAEGITERHGAKPFAFRFHTSERDADQLDSSVSARSGLYYLGGRVMTLEDVEREMPDEKTLLWNMRVNEITRVIVNDNSWRSINALEAEDVVLPWPYPGTE